MKNLHFSKMIILAALCFSTASLGSIYPAFAQTDTTTTAAPTDVTDNNPDWSWLGLLGLIGLAGLAGRNRDEPARYRDPNVSTGSEFRR